MCRNNTSKDVIEIDVFYLPAIYLEIFCLNIQKYSPDVCRIWNLVLIREIILNRTNDTIGENPSRKNS